jgi:D-aspartate ligase
MRPSTLPPALILDGGANVLSVARSLGRRGIRVVVPGKGNEYIRFSRFGERIPLQDGGNEHRQWLSWLAREGVQRFRGGVVIPCGDSGLEFIVRYRAELEKDFRVYEANDAVLAAMLDKAETHALAKKAGVPAPQVWIVHSLDDVQRVMHDVEYPCGLKPRVSHEFKKYFTEKLFVAHSPDELLRAYARVEPLKMEMMLTELIPGGDSGYCSYYSYLDERGEPLFHFTKQKLRQYPNGFGIGTLHLTDWNAEVAELGLKFFQGIGLRGYACVEFKRDPRDGKLKLIECNHRLTEPNELLIRSGLDVPSLIYNRLTGLPLPKLDTYRRNVTLIKPWEDLLACRQLRKRKELTYRTWLRSVMRPHCFLYFSWRDPFPLLSQFLWYWRRQISKIRRVLSGQSRKRIVARPSLAEAES